VLFLNAEHLVVNNQSIIEKHIKGREEHNKEIIKLYIIMSEIKITKDSLENAILKDG